MHRRGFTLVEIIIALAIIVTLAGVTAAAFQNMYRAGALTTAQQAVYTAFRDTRTNTLASRNDTVYGVHVSTSSVTRFVGGAYNPAAVTNEEYLFEGGVTATGTLVIGGTSVVFKRLTGEPNVEGQIILESADGQAVKTVTIHSSGLIE